MKIKKNTLKILLIVFLLLISLGGLYYYFFIKLDSDWMFWKSNGEDIDWSSIEYDDDFYPTDTVEVYGEYGEWKFKEFKPVYAGYGTTEDDLNYLIGKYLDENGDEQTVNILVSGGGIVDWPYPDKGFVEFYNSYYKNNVAIRGDEADPKPTEDIGTLEYSADDEYYSLTDSELYSCPEEVIMTADQVNTYVSFASDLPGYYFVELDTYYEYCNPYSMYYNDYPSKVLTTFEEVVKKLEVGSQFSVRYLESEKTFAECQYNYDDVQKIFCANQYLNETYDGEYLVGIYVVLEQE